MQINTHSSQEIAAKDRMESAYPLQCPVCSGSLVPLNNMYRCLRCCYHVCAGCSQLDLGPPGDE